LGRPATPGNAPPETAAIRDRLTASDLDGKRFLLEQSEIDRLRE